MVDVDVADAGTAGRTPVAGTAAGRTPTALTDADADADEGRIFVPEVWGIEIDLLGKDAPPRMPEPPINESSATDL